MSPGREVRLKLSVKKTVVLFKILYFVLQNRRVNVQMIADAVGISTGSVKTILRKHLLMRKVCACWVTRMLEQTRKLCYRKDDRAMRPTYGCPENFRDCLTTPTATIPNIFMGFCSDRLYECSYKI